MADSELAYETTQTVTFESEQDESAPCLVMIRGPQLGRRIQLPSGETVLGRSPECGVVVPLDGVSRRHCAFTVASGAVAVRDLGSKNGTWVNGQRIDPHLALALVNGAVLHTGDASFKFISHGDAEASYHEAVYKMLTEDALTGAKNRRFLMDVLEREVAREHRGENGLALLLVDIDQFKRINDESGHVFGDYVLREVAVLITGQARRTDCLARYGGDEFAVVLTESTRAGAEIFAERLRGQVESTRFELDAVSSPVTLSIGVAIWQPEIGTPDAFLNAADVALYAAKAAGRNRVAS
ncbi:MAG TPA: GGDEF domain-containing protein [Myxococcota bacterium]|jgi:diguanylate cyclase (GGDEF)-like protein